MDELIIENKKYLSSKKAAQITGYAKDYVGQLCREGRVEARLVGRNWYVLEDSILEHRFGEEEVEKQAEKEQDKPAQSWQPATYISEPSDSLPIIAQKEVISEPAVTPEPQKVLTDMQSAWQEWFEIQEKRLPDASPMLLEDHVEEEPERPLEASKEATASLSTSDEGEPVTLHREHVSAPYRPSETPVSYRNDASIEELPIPRRSERVASRQRPMSARTRRVVRRRSGSLIYKALFLGLLVIAITVTILGSGVADVYLTGRGVNSPVTDFFGGISEVNK